MALRSRERGFVDQSICGPGKKYFVTQGRDHISGVLMNDTELGISRCGDKRKVPKGEKMASREKSQKKPWGTDGPPPPEWVEVYMSRSMPLMTSR